MRARLALAALLAAGPAPAAVVVVLDDGTSIRGIAARREGDRLALTLGEDERVLVPVAEVVEVRTVEDDARPAPAPEGVGVLRRPARQLAGNRIDPTTPREQTAVLGDPARFAPDLVPARPWPRSDWPADPAAGNNFAPSAWAESPVDPRWKPRSGLPREDALAASRARWPFPARLAEWDPEDGWKAQRAIFGTATVGSARRAHLSLPEQAEACGRRIAAADPGGRAEGIRVGALEGRPFDALPIRLYEVERRESGRLRRSVFAIEGEVCRPLAGDLATATLARYNRAVARALEATPLLPGEPVARALAIVTLLDPTAMGARRERPVLLGAAADLDRLAAVEPPACELTPEARRRVHTVARRAVTPPRVGADEGTVAFWTWSPRGGVLARHLVRIGEDGAVAVTSEPAAHHLGDHRDEPAPGPTVAAR
jgi:hypothetical protein